MLIVNFKNYPQALGDAGLELARKLETAAADFSKIKTVLAISPVDVFRISQAIKLPIFSQHVDPFDPGQTTGFVIPEVIKEAGAKGTLINHSEHPMSVDMVEDAVKRCREIDLSTVVCADSLAVVTQVKEFKPDFIAYEPPELIGGDVSVVSAEPDVVSAAVREASPVFLIVGAGVHSGEDVRVALGLGAIGVLVSSDIVTAEDPTKEFSDIAQGFSASAPRG